MRPLTPQLAIVLRQAAAAGREWYGRELVEVTGLAEGTVYPMLGRLEARGFIVSRWEAPGERVGERRGARRRYYRVTGAGLGAAAAAAEVAAGQRVDRTAPAPWPETTGMVV
jgi:PadR family transcriptional regulator PadR